MSDLQDRSRGNNLTIDDFKELGNEGWEQTEEILQQMICNVI